MLYFTPFLVPPSFVLNLDPEKQTSRHGSDYTPGPTVQHHNNGHFTAIAGMYIMCCNFYINLSCSLIFCKGIPTSPAEVNLQDIAAQAGLQRLDILDQECSQQVLLSLAKHCVEWQFVGFQLDLTKADIVAVNGDYGSIDEKRFGML